MKARIPKNAGGGNIMEQLQKMQEDMQSKTAELEERDYEVRAGGGLVRVLMTGRKQIKELELDADIVDPDDIETLQDLIIAAVNEAISTVEETAAKEMETITTAMPPIPGLMG